MSGFTDFLQSIVQRLGQQAQATQQGTLGIGPDPTQGPAIHYGALPGALAVPLRVPVTALQGAGLVQEAGQNIGNAISGEGIVALANIMRLSRAASGPDIATTPMSQLAEQAAAAGPLHPLQAQALAQHAPNSAVSWGAGGLGLVANPLNLVDAAGIAGEALRAGGSPALRALGIALQGAGKVGEYGNAPGAALFRGAAQGLTRGPLAGLTAAAEELGAGRLRGLGHAIAQPAGPLAGLLQDTAIAAPPGRFVPEPTGLPPGVVRPAPQTMVPRLVRPAPQEQVSRLVRAAPQTGVPALLPPETYTRAPTFAYGPASLLQEAAQGLGLTDQPAGTPQTIADLAAAMRGVMPPAAATTPWEDFATGRAATYRTFIPRTTGGPTTPPDTIAALTEALRAPEGVPAPAPPPPIDWTDRTGIITQAANAPLGHLNSILADLHNAIYPGQSADFAIPALTGQPKAAFRTSFLTDHPQGNAAEPYLDYLLNRVQSDPKAAARLADLNPTLADDIANLAPSELGTTEHKGLIQSLFKGVGEPPPVGLLPGVTRLGLSGGGALGGTALGGAIGGRFGDTPEERRANANLGGAIGGTIGGGLGLAAGSPTMRAIGQEGVAAMREAAATGERGLLPQQGHAMGYIRSLRKTGLFTVPRNAMGAMGNIVMAGGDLPQALSYAREFWGNMPTLLPALRAAGSDDAAKAAAMYAALPADMQQYGEQGIGRLMAHSGSAYERNAADLGAAHVAPLAGAIRGAVLGAASPRVAVLGLPSLALGAAEGATLPARAAMQNAFATAIDVPARVALSFPAYAAGLEAEAPAFIAKVRATNPANAATLDAAGHFDPTAITDSGLAAEWGHIQDHVAETAGQIATDRMGDFTTTKGAMGLFNTIFPGGVWNVQQAAVLARAAADHPALALAALAAMRDDYAAHLARGDPQHAGTWQITDRTPGFGALVRLANGGGAGSFYVNPAYPFSPFSGETLNLPRALSPMLNPGQNLYDRALKIGGALGLAVNPEIQLAAYKEGVSSVPMTNPLRLEPVGQYLDARLGGDAGLTANPLAQGLSPDGSVANIADINLQLRQGRYLDPAIARAGAEIIYEQTHIPAGDPRNAPLLDELRDHNSPLYAQALERGLGSKAATASLNEALPVSGQAESQTAGDVGRAQQLLFARGIPFTKQQVAALASGDRVTGQMALQQALDAAKVRDPLLRVEDAATPEAQATALLDAWKRRFSGLPYFPALYQQQLAHQGERLGLVPAGTAAATQAAYDAALAGQRYGPVPTFPGGPPPQLDPHLISQLQDFFNRGGR